MSGRGGRGHGGRGNGRHSNGGRGGPGRGPGRGQGRGETPVAMTQIAISSFPILRTGVNNNFAVFWAALEIYLRREYGNLARFLNSDKYYVPPELVFPEEDWENEAKKAVMLGLINARTKEITTMAENRMSACASIWGNLSEESQSLIRQSDLWPKIEPMDDPLSLTIAIKKTHIIASVGNAVIDQAAARKAYNKVQQNPHESLVVYKRHFDDAITAMVSVGETKPSEDKLAADFIDRLDNNRYASLKATLTNNVTMNLGTYPATLTEAYDLCGKFQVVKTNSNSNATQQTAFVTSADVVNNNNKGKHNSNNKNDKKKDGNAAASTTTTTAAANTNGNKSGKPFKFNCNTCGEAGHKAQECPRAAQFQEFLASKKSGEKQVVAVTTNHLPFQQNNLDGYNHWGFVASGGGDPGPFEVLLDNQATKSVFHQSKLLTNITTTDVDVSFNGVGGASTTNMTGIVPYFGEVSYLPSSIANILSLREVEDKYEVHYVQRVSFTVIINDDVRFVFTRKVNGLYTCNMRPLANELARGVQFAMIQTVKDNASMYTKRELESAKAAYKLMEDMGYISAHDLIKLIQSGGLLNCPVTAHDVARAFKIFGPPVAAIKGKLKHHASEVVKIEGAVREVVVDLEMHIDIMFVNGDKFLVSVTKPLGLTMVTNIPDRGTVEVRKALNTQLNNYTSRQFKIRTILTDGEGAIAKLTTELNAAGIVVNPAGPGQHVPVIENKIRQIKERVRSVVHSLPYLVCRKLMSLLVSFCVSRLNMVKSSLRIDDTPPIEIFQNRKTDVKRDLRIGFGEYVQVESPNIVKNSMEARSQGAISLFSAGNAQGSVSFLLLGTMTVVTRDKWVKLPMPDIVIGKLNQLANEDKIKPTRDPIFKMNDQEIQGLYDESTEQIVPGNLVSEVKTRKVSEGEQALANNILPEIDMSEQSLVVQDADVIDVVGDYGEEAIENNLDSNQQEPPAVVEADHLNDDAPAVRGAAGEVADPPPVTPAVVQGVGKNNNYVPIHGYKTRLRYEFEKKNNINPEHTFHISIKTAMKKDKDAALTAIEGEMKQLVNDKEVFECVDANQLTVAQRKSVIPGFMFMKEKYKPNGDFDKLKARLVAGGHMQDPLTYGDISSPTVGLSAVMIVAAIAKREKRSVVTVDITGAYLNAKMPEGHDVFIRLDPLLSELAIKMDPSFARYRMKNGAIIARLRRALYGCVESAKLWNEMVSDTLKADGYLPNPKEACVFNKTSSTGKVITVVVYVDDLMITSNDDDEIEHLVEYLQEKFKTLNKNHGEIHSYLGMVFDFSGEELKISMPGYESDFLQSYGVTGTAITPATNELFVIRDGAAPLDPEKALEFHSIVAKLLYLAKRTRPDILTSIAFLSTRVQAPTEDDYKKLGRVLKYLNGTRGKGIALGASDVVPQAYIDASYGVHGDGKSHSGLFITLGKGPIFVQSSKQKLVSKSSTEAELIALSDSVGQVIWVRDFIKYQGYPDISPAVVYQDNKSTISLVANGPTNAPGTRHIHIRYFFVRDRVEQGDVKVEYLSTDKMISDFFTKPLQGTAFKEKQRLLLGGGDKEMA